MYHSEHKSPNYQMSTGQKNTLAEQMLGFVEDMAQAQNIISSEALKTYREAIFPRARALVEVSGSQQGQGLEDLIREQHSLKPDEKVQIAQLAALESRMLRTLQFYEMGRRQRSPKEEFLNNFKEILRRDGVDLDAKERPSGPLSTPHLDAVAKTVPAAKIINVITKHPVEWETDVMREGEWDLADRLKQMGPQLENPGFGERIAPDQFRPIEEWTHGMLEKIKNGQDLTYFTKNTVPKENASASMYYERIMKQFEDVAGQYNAALDEIRQHPNLPDEIRPKLEAMRIDKNKYELHSWALSGDGDGRPDSTDIALWRGVMQGLSEDGSYRGPVIDLRHNAEEQRDLLSAAIQRKYINSQYGKRQETKTFEALCNNFTNGKKTIKEEDYNPDASIFQELKLDDQAAFARLLLTHDLPAVTLIEKDVKDQVTDFLPQFNAIYDKFLKEHKLPPTTAFKDLREHADDEHGDLWGKLRDLVLNETLQREMKGEGKAYRLNDFGSYSPLSAKDHASYFEGRKMLSDKGEVVDMGQAQRDFSLGIFKRLVIADHYIDKSGEKKRDSDGTEHWNSDIFQRYKIANFGNEADFYIAMELFKEAGLISVKKGIVTEAKMGIMPLLETNQDMDNAEKIFGNLLNDPLVKSYWEQRGKAEVMVGYSDGSKSASSGPSQNKIRETKEKLITLFAKKGIKLHVHEGPGYGLDRGGVLEAGAVMLRQPTELQERGLYDLTIQGTLPRDMAGFPEFGKHYLSSMIIGIMTGAQHAAKQSDPAVADRQRQYDAARHFIFEEATKDFQAFRAEHQQEILDVIARMPKNPDKNSRPEVRTEADPKADPAHIYDSTRMIGIEYAMRGMKLPFFEIGLKNGLQKCIDSGMELPDAKGHMQSGIKALQTLATEDEMFKLQMKLRQVSMSSYRKDVAEQWGQLTDRPDFVRAAADRLDGLIPLIAEIREGGGKNLQMKDGTTVSRKQIVLNNEMKWADSLKKERNPYLDYFANAAALSNTLDMVAQTALLSEAYDGSRQKVISIAKADAKTMNPKNKRKDPEHIRMLRNWELCTAVPVETQHINPLAAEIREQVEGRGI